MEFIDIDEYIMKLRNKAGYEELSEKERQEVVFEAEELLKDNFAVRMLSPRLVALQSIFTLEGEEEGFGRLKRQGAKSYGVKGVSVSFEGSGISPEVVALINAKTASVGRFYQ